MTNFEWLLENKKDLVKELILGERLARQLGEFTTCMSICCEDCDWDKECDRQDNFVREWLDEEHEEPSPYEDWQIDDKIEGSNDGENWTRGHFAGISKNGKPTTWCDGWTSWTTEDDNDKVYWKHARKVEE